MTEKNDQSGKALKTEAGIALVLAIMALMLLTFLGLTLATTTSTELQIATNYRWSQQALYNAEAGIEAGKVILRNIPGPVSWDNILPQARPGAFWTMTPGSAASTPPIPPGGMPPYDDWGNPLRNWENGGCDNREGNVGYGVVLVDNVSTLAEGVMQNKTVVLGQRLNGAVTIWVRRGSGVAVDGTIRDATPATGLILTAEGVAPYSDRDIASAFAQANQATRVLEVALLRALGGSSPCREYGEKGGVLGTNFSTCNRVNLDCGGGAGGKEDELLGGALGDAARAAGGTLGHGSGAAGTHASKQDPNNPGNCVQ